MRKRSVPMTKNVLNSAEMKWQNQKRILNLLHISPCSRAELARQTGLTRAAISIIVDELFSLEYIIEGEPILGKVGRKSFVLKLNPHRFYIIGINIARNRCKVGITNFNGDLLYHTTLEMLQTPNEMLDNTTTILRENLKHNTYVGDLLGIGITAPGPVDTTNGRILNPPNFETWAFTNIANYFQQEFQCPVVLENNSNALALAERFHGAGANYHSYVELNVDSGIGSGVILDGELYKGTSGFGNDFGHMSIHFLGKTCRCGNIGCAELYASTPNIVRYANQLGLDFSEWSAIVDAALFGNTDALKIVEKEANFLSLIIINIINILDVDAIIIAGDLLYRNELLLDLLRTQVNQRILTRAVKQVDIIPSLIIHDGPLLSSANLMLDYFFKHDA